ncbi:BON1-associated protein 2-like [Abrus precatorius]|uniref:BON1-associated protein 2-like n=1 Tax=Abrus precatorius TaxID=3816 RepID=A0A8B8K1U7_ABRPR|nr:BON1-associated protein 2-like [Abrus precatorius]
MIKGSKSRTLEVTILSAEDLRINGKAANKNVFVGVRADSLTSQMTTMKGNGEGGGFHTWNEKFLVELRERVMDVTFEVKSKTGTRVKDVGVARVAVKDFLGGSVPNHCLQFLSYRLRDWDGLRNGIINFSVRVVGAEEVVAGSCGSQKGAQSVSSCEGVVTGIPVRWNASTSISQV